MFLCTSKVENPRCALKSPVLFPEYTDATLEVLIWVVLGWAQARAPWSPPPVECRGGLGGSRFHPHREGLQRATVCHLEEALSQGLWNPSPRFPSVLAKEHSTGYLVTAFQTEAMGIHTWVLYCNICVPEMPHVLQNHTLKISGRLGKTAFPTGHFINRPF